MDFGSIIRRSASIFRNNGAVLFEGRRLTYAELYERSCRLASALNKLGLRKGDRVAVLGDNMLESLEEICAFALAGLVRTTLYTQNAPEVQIYMLNLTGARALIVQDSYYENLATRISEARDLEHVIAHGGGDRAVDYDELIEGTIPDDPEVPISDEDLFAIRFSAGTTGRPKAIAHTVGAWRAMVTDFALVVPRMDEDDTFLVAGPLSHGAGTIVWPMVSFGVKQVILPAFDPSRVLELIERERCTVTFLVPSLIQKVVNHPDAKKRDLSSLKAVFYGAAPIAEQTLLEAQAAWGNIMYQIYGQTEGGPATVLTPRHHVVDGTERERRWLRSAGRPCPNALIKILDNSGRDLPTGKVGEITIKTPGIMKELWSDSEATAQRLSKDGWLSTRDLGYLDEEGFLYIADRKEDMIISAGFNIWPAEIENALFSHPAVLEAVVVGVPHETLGETPKAVVVFREGQQATEDELIVWCRGKIGSTKEPSSVEFRDEPLPKSSAGKVLRRVVREAYWEGAERRVSGA